MLEVLVILVRVIYRVDPGEASYVLLLVLELSLCCLIVGILILFFPEKVSDGRISSDELFYYKQFTDCSKLSLAELINLFFSSIIWF